MYCYLFHRCAITIGNIGEYVTIHEKITNGSEFKERIDEAIRLNNRDEMSYYLLGRWSYSVGGLTPSSSHHVVSL